MEIEKSMSKSIPFPDVIFFSVTTLYDFGDGYVPIVIEYGFIRGGDSRTEDVTI